MSKRLPTQLLECRRHIHFIEHARHHIPTPTAALLGNPSDELVAALDQFVYRFSKLQDTLGRRKGSRKREGVKEGRGQEEGRGRKGSSIILRKQGREGVKCGKGSRKQGRGQVSYCTIYLSP